MRILSACCAALLASCAIDPVAPTTTATHELAPTGTLRVAVLTSNPIIGSKDANTGALSGTTVSVARVIALRAGVQARMIEYPAIPQLMAHATAGVWDLAVVAIDPARRNVVDFAPPHLQSGGLRLAFALPKNRPLALKYVSDFVEEAKENGLIDAAIRDAGLGGEVSAAPLVGH